MPIYNSSVEVAELPNFEGTRSMFNPYVIFSLYDVGSMSKGQYKYTGHYDMLPSGNTQLDNNYTEQTYTKEQLESLEPTNELESYEKYRYENTKNRVKSGVNTMSELDIKRQRLVPTAENIINFHRETTKVYGYGPTPYSWSDFLYCKYYGKIPNNRLITLRRYPYPVADNVVIANSNAMLPVAQAVTWFSEETENSLSEILKMTYGVMWKEIEAEVQEVDGNEQAFGSGFESYLGPKVVGAMGAVLTASRGSYDLWSGRAEKEVEWSKKSFTNEGPYWNQVYGPVNVVHKSHMRERGLKFTNDITLKFHYSLESYQGVNPKVAMLDLITNFLLLTYTNAKFWGGATRYFPNASMRVGFLGDQNKFYAGDFLGYAKSVGSALNGTLEKFGDALKAIMSGDFSSITGMIASIIGDKLTEKSQPQALSIRSLLSGEPVGEWHLTVGNPMNPIVVMGNLILDETSITFGEALGIDDFPTEVTFEVKLKHGKPRDKGDIESMFNNGYGRMTYSQTNPLASQSNTFKTAAGTAAQGKDGAEAKEAAAVPSADNPQGLYDYYTTGAGLNDVSFKSVKERVQEIWGTPFADSANLIFLVNSAKGRF